MHLLMHSSAQHYLEAVTSSAPCTAQDMFHVISVMRLHHPLMPAFANVLPHLQCIQRQWFRMS